VVQVQQDDFVSFKYLAHGYFSWQQVQVSKPNLDVNTSDIVSFKIKLNDQEDQHEVLLQKPGGPIVWSTFTGILGLLTMQVKDLFCLITDRRCAKYIDF